jgi:hypothetical protein
LESDRDRLLTDIEVAKAADQPKAIKLAGALLEAADQRHLTVEIEQFVLARLIPAGFAGAFTIRKKIGLRGRRALRGSSRQGSGPLDRRMILGAV